MVQTLVLGVYLVPFWNILKLFLSFIEKTMSPIGNNQYLTIGGMIIAY